MNIFWFRRDLRLEDNAALYLALQSGSPVLPIFIFDSNILGELPKDDARVTFIHSLLTQINETLATYSKSLAVFHGDPETIFRELMKVNTINKVFTNEDYEPYALVRDVAIKSLLSKNKIDFLTFKDHVIFAKDEVVKDDGLPYVVFTPFSNKWKSQLANKQPVQYQSADFLNNFFTHSYPFLSLSDIGFKLSMIAVPDFDTSQSVIDNYEMTRNFPALRGTSGLSPHLRFGAVSVRKICAAAMNAQNKTFLNELIWREFFMQILWHFPRTVGESFRPKYDRIVWRNDPVEFKSWREGKTGYPIVDAGMRQLNTTGLMHNRVRMITASFLCKHLLIDWRLGEAYFAEKLLDYEQSSNVGNWQWAAGSGVDAAPYFRIFSPSEQAKKFDKQLQYISKWVPEINEFSYPQPIVDHKEARARCLSVYKEALDN